MALSIRTDLAGVTSLVRGLALVPSDDERLLPHFYSSGLDLARLSTLWATKEDAGTMVTIRRGQEAASVRGSR